MQVWLWLKSETHIAGGYVKYCTHHSNQYEDVSKTKTSNFIHPSVLPFLGVKDIT